MDYERIVGKEAYLDTFPNLDEVKEKSVELLKLYQQTKMSPGKYIDQFKDKVSSSSSSYFFSFFKKS